MTAPLEENVNRLVVDGVEARNIDEAIGALSLSPAAAVDRHPGKHLALIAEYQYSIHWILTGHTQILYIDFWLVYILEKRMKAAFEDFESLRLPQLKLENPSMRLSQLKQLLRKEWQKHPDNPLNRAMAAAAAASRN